MTGEKIEFEEALAEKSAVASTRTNERSTIDFPYLDLEVAIEVATKLYGRTALSACPFDELAAEMGQTAKSGNFRLKTATARMFGLIEKDTQTAVRLTDLGCRMVSPDGQKDAKTDAFLSVPLYAQIYEKYRGKLLPPTKALEREMQLFGVASKQSDRARLAFQRSARQSGFFDSGEDRLVRPRSDNAGSSVGETLDQAAADKRDMQGHRPGSEFRGGGGGGGDDTLHPFIQGLLRTLPEPETLWTIEGRAAWLQAAATCFQLIYRGDGSIKVEVEPGKRASSGDT